MAMLINVQHCWSFFFYNHAYFTIVRGSFCGDFVFLVVVMHGLDKSLNTFTIYSTKHLKAALFAGDLSCFAAV